MSRREKRTTTTWSPIEVLALHLPVGERRGQLGTFSLGDVQKAVEIKRDEAIRDSVLVAQLSDKYGAAALIAEANLTSAELQALVAAATAATRGAHVIEVRP